MDDLLAPAPPSNIPEYAVGEISNAIRRTLESTFGRVRVRGELTEVKRYGSGHIYLSLKDESGKLSGVIWKSSVPKLAVQPENGIEVIATGRITAYADRSAYQLIIERLDYAGAGALLARIEALRLRLAAEGLFDAARKRPIPRLPSLIGLVTSAQGAVLHDIRTTIARRFPTPLLLWPVPVQGEAAEARIAEAITGFCALPATGPLRRPDLLIVARGGGSLEDLMAFNTERVVRAAATCTIPLISAIGHETDTTLIDHAASRRAPTPTAAAELAVPARAELLSALTQTGARLISALNTRTAQSRLALHRAERGLPDLPMLANLARQRLDHHDLRLRQALPTRLAAARRTFTQFATRLDPAPAALAQRSRHTLTLRSGELRAALRHALAMHHRRAGATLARLTPAPILASLRQSRAKLDGASRHLEAVSFNSVLARGFAIVSDQAGHTLTRAAAIPPNTTLTLRFADGTTEAKSARASGQGRLL